MKYSPPELKRFFSTVPVLLLLMVHGAVGTDWSSGAGIPQLAQTGNDREVTDYSTSGGTKMKGVGPNPVNNAVELKISQSSRYLDEGGTAPTFKVWLSDDPTGNVTVTLTLHSRNTVALTLSPSGPLTFTPTSWEEHDAQTVTVTVQDNTIIDADGRQRIDLAASGGGADGATARARFDFRDNDRPAVTLTASPNPVIEGTVVTITATLSEDPDADVTIPLEIPDPVDGEFTSPTTHAITIAGTGTGTTGTLDIQTNEDDNDIEDETLTVGLDTDASNWPSAWGAGTPSSVAITIDDNDKRSVDIWANPQVAEGSVVTIWVTLTEDPSADVTIPLKIPDPIDGEYTLPNTHAVTIAGTGTGRIGTLDIQTNEDADRDDETFTVELDMDSSDWPPEWDGVETLWITRQKRRITIIDNDKPTVSISASPNPVGEGSAVTITVKLSEDPSADVTIPLEIPAPADGEYTVPTNAEITIAGAGTGTTGTLDIQTNQDSDEDNETFTVELDTDDTDWPSDWNAGDPSSVDITITDDDKPTVRLTASPNPVDEGSTVTITATLSEDPTSDVTIPLTIPTPGDGEYTVPTNAEITIAGTGTGTTGTLDIQTNEDSDLDDETFTVELDTDDTDWPSAYNPGTAKSVEITITDNDEAVTLETSGGRANLYEGRTAPKFKVWLSGQPSADVTVTMTLGDRNTVTLGLSPAGPLTFTTNAWDEANAQEVTVSVPDNSVDEPDGWQYIYLQGSGGGVDTGRERVAFYFRDNDIGPNVTLSASPNPVTEGSAVTITATLSEDPDSDVTIPLDIPDPRGGEYTSPTAAEITITGAGSGMTGTLEIQTNEDANMDDETFTVELDTDDTDWPSDWGAGDPSSVEITISDNDGPVLEVSQSSQDLHEGRDSETFSVNLTNVPSGNVTVTLTLDSDNSVALTLDPLGPLTFTSDNWSEVQTVSVSVPDNTILEADAVQRINLAASGGGADGARANVDFWVFDNDASTLEVTLAASPNPVDEGGTVTVTATLSETPATDVVIPLTFSAGTAEVSDYGGLTTSSITIIGTGIETTGTLDIATIEDDGEYDDETFTVAFGTLPTGVVAGDPSSVEITIEDNDVLEVTLSASPLSVVEGGIITVTAALSEALPNPVAIDLADTHISTEPADYDPLASITIPGGQLAASGDLVTNDDDLAESDETFTLALGDLPAGLIPGDPSSVELTILDDGDIPPPSEVSVFVNPAEVTEGGVVTVELQLTETLATDVEVPLIYPSGGVTAEPEDYVPLELVLIPSGQAVGSGQITTIRDMDTDDETFTVELDSTNLPTGVVAGSPVSEEVTIRDLDAAANLSVDQNPVDEGESVTVTVQLSNALNTDVAIPLTLSPGTAESSDYDSTSPVNLNIDSGTKEAEYIIQTYRDNDIEDETFTVELDTTNLPSGIVASSPISEEVTITDLDMPGISTPTSVELKEGEMSSINVALTTQPSSDVTVTLSGHENTDLMLDVNVLTFTTSNWNQEQTVTLTATEDTDLLDDEVTLTLSASGSGYVVSHTLTVTIQDNMGVGTEQTEEAISLALSGNYPNPLSNSTKIVFDLPEPAQVSVAITDLLGRTVKILPDKSFGVGTEHTLQINTGDLPSGAYFYTLKIVMDDKVVRRSKAMSIVR